jgi:L-threonine kinase
MEKIEVKTFASIGEIAQGSFSPGRRFLFSNLHSRKFFTTTYIERSEQIIFNLGEKASTACKIYLEKLLSHTGLNVSRHPFSIWQESNIPKSKGLSSSSADVLGALAALNQHFGSPYTKEDLYAIASKADPTDACLSAPLTVICPASGEIIASPGILPYSIIYFDTDPEGLVDTVSFSESISLANGDYLFYNQLFKKLTFAINRADYSDFIFWTTQSAVYNQRFLPKKGFNGLLSFAVNNKLGVFVAHSGTFAGLVVAGELTEKTYRKATNFIHSNWDTEIFTESNVPSKFLVDA